jgi:hypothetical protein
VGIGRLVIPGVEQSETQPDTATKNSIPWGLISLAKLQEAAVRRRLRVRSTMSQAQIPRIAGWQN